MPAKAGTPMKRCRLKPVLQLNLHFAPQSDLGTITRADIRLILSNPKGFTGARVVFVRGRKSISTSEAMVT
jgi:hypothetical protein